MFETNLLDRVVAEVRDHWRSWWQEHAVETAPAQISDAALWQQAEQAAERLGLEVVRDADGLPSLWRPANGGRRW